VKSRIAPKIKINPKTIAIPRVPKNEPPDVVGATLGEPFKALGARVLAVVGAPGLVRGSVSSVVLKPGLTVSYRPASTRSDSVFPPTIFKR
jgi:hypothetical protein